MPNQYTDITLVEEKFGPAMLALAPRHRAFAIAYVTLTHGDATKAAKEAGYPVNKNGVPLAENGVGGIGVQAHRLLNRPDVLAAIRELVVSRVAGNLPVYVNALEKVAASAQHKDQVKAIGMLLSRGGLPDITQRDLNINITVSKDQQIAEIRQMAEEMGLDPNKLLGTVTDAEFTEIPKGLEDVW